MSDMIPIARPLLPPVERLAPYLAEIDSRRTYTNFGPLTLRLEERLAARFGAPAGGACTTVNATLGIAMALMAQAPPPGSLCILPAWTFGASAHAALAAGLEPLFVDCDPASWVVDPAAVRAAIRAAPRPVGALMVVSPYGAPLDYTGWCDLAAAEGIALVFDSAAAFDTAVAPRYPAVISLHATKVLGSGEGGVILCTDPEIAAHARRIANLGFRGSRSAQVRAFNGRLSEYHAAVGLASLDAWDEDRARWMGVAAAYRRQLDPLNGVRVQEAWGQGWIGSTCVIEIAEGDGHATGQALAARGIDTRRWWGDGCYLEPAFAGYGRAPLIHTPGVARRTLGLPYYVDMPEASVSAVGLALAEALRP